MADGVACDEVGREFVDDGADHRVEVGDLVMQFEIAASERLEADPVGRFHVAIGRQIRPPGGQGSNELHAGHAAQQISQSVGRADDRVLDHLQGDAPRRYGCLAASREDAQGFDHAVAASRRDGSLAGKGGMGRILRVEIVVLATSTAIVLVRRRDLQNLDPRALHEAKQAGAIAAGRLDADALDLTEGSHPGEHLPITLPGRGEASAPQNTILFIDDGRDMQILVGVDAADDTSLCLRP